MTNQLPLTKTHARKILKLVDCGLVNGVGEPKPGAMCIMAVFNHALGRPHGDAGLEDCVGEAVRSFDIALNDCSWSSPAARSKGMRREAIAKIGSNQNGHDFWLSRNGHGTGFFDRDCEPHAEEIRDRLQDAARACGEVNLYVGDDGKIYA